jgi:uncharacterized protein (DUF1697 family)
MLRGVNVAGQKKLKMRELAESYTALGFEDVRTYIQSGNVVFSTSIADASSIVKLVEKELKGRFGHEVTVFVRTPNELAKIVARNPFAGKDQSKLHVTFLYMKPLGVPTDKIDAARSVGEEFSISEREVFLFCPNGYGRSKLSNNFFEKALTVAATTRNWNTVTTLLSMAEEATRNR